MNNQQQNTSLNNTNQFIRKEDNMQPLNQQPLNQQPAQPAPTQFISTQFNTTPNVGTINNTQATTYTNPNQPHIMQQSTTRQIAEDIATNLNNNSTNLFNPTQAINSLSKETSLIDLKELRENLPYRGIAWCLSTKTIINKFDKTRLDKIYTLVDRNGISFISRIYSATSVNEPTEHIYINVPVLISGSVIRPYEDLIYRTDEIFAFNGFPVSLKDFISELTDLQQQINTYNNWIASITDPAINTLLSAINQQCSTIDLFSNTSYKIGIGNLLGIKFKLFNYVLHSLSIKSELINFNDTKDFYILSLNLYFIIVSYQTTAADNLHQNINHLSQLILGSTLSEEQKYYLTSFLYTSSNTNTNHSLSDDYNTLSKNSLLKSLIDELKAFERIL